MENNPLISVIMPVYNCEKYVGEAIQSIIDQTYANWELLICDDGSSDKSYYEISKFHDNRIRISKNENNQSKVITCNNLLKECKGELVTIHDADDYSHTNRFQLITEKFEEDPFLYMVGSNAFIVNRKGSLIRTTNYRLDYDGIKKNISLSNQFMGASVFIKRTELVKLNGYRSFFVNYSCEDYDLTSRIVLSGKSINLPDKLYYYRQHNNGLSKNVDLKRYISENIVSWLINQRENAGTDSLDKNDSSELNNYISGQVYIYEKDPSLIYHQYGSNFLYNRMYGKALKTALFAIKQVPGEIKNYRLFFYILRKFFYHKFLCAG
ncbi:MAG: glycosyltransferase family 2 protein [Cyclobacteriaceae bacterium]|nr:glycosyltransferase family 2 protein [Cyclobacteriaceae bacterium]